MPDQSLFIFNYTNILRKDDYFKTFLSRLCKFVLQLYVVNRVF
jgi:hypothetical protein